MQRLRQILSELELAHADMVADTYIDSHDALEQADEEPDQLKNAIASLDEFIYDSTHD